MVLYYLQSMVSTTEQTHHSDTEECKLSLVNYEALKFILFSCCEAMYSWFGHNIMINCAALLYVQLGSL